MISVCNMLRLKQIRTQTHGSSNCIHSRSLLNNETKHSLQQLYLLSMRHRLLIYVNHFADPEYGGHTSKDKHQNTRANMSKMN
jgi:hypothetical protein